MFFMPQSTTMPESTASLDEKPQSRGVDRRQWIRYPVRLAINCRLDQSPDEPAWPALVQNVSHGGLRLLGPQSVDQGAIIAITPSNPQLLPRFARVVYVREKQDGKWIIGCAFTRERIDERELLKWIKHQNGKL